MSKLQLIFAISQLKGGGAEHVMMNLTNYLLKKGHSVQMLVTNQKSVDSDCSGLDKRVKVTYLEDCFVQTSQKNFVVRITNLFCKIFEFMEKKVPDVLAKKSFDNIYGNHVKAARKFLENNEGCTVVVFLQPANQIVLRACENLNNKVVISERADPTRYFKTRYANFFLKKYYPSVNGAVFQTPEAMEMYSTIKTLNKKVILNPIPTGLPEAYEGKREKIIVNFCRLAKQKNLPLLIDAFEIFSETHEEYVLEIIGDGELRESLLNYINDKKCADRIRLVKHIDNVHSRIRKYTMFVSSSDYEGMSNSMLEAMAIGLPVVCTDCPIGGARLVIHDHVNGILVPVNDVNMLATAMAQVADDEKLSKEISRKATEVRNNQSIEKIGAFWEIILENA